jgi:Rubrerythrin
MEHVSGDVMPSETTALLFDLAIAGEKASAEFYDGLAGKFRHNPEVCAFWKTMAADERQHVRILGNIHKSLTSAQLAVPADQPVIQSAIENSRVQIRDVLGMVRNLNDAYILAHLWENSEINGVFEFIVRKFIPFADDGRNVRLQIINHTNRLMMFSQAFGEAEVRKEIMAVD